MAIDLVNIPSAKLRKVNPDVADGFRALREAINKAGPLDATTSELILVSAFAAAGFEESLKIHALRGLKAGIPKAALQHAVLLTLGATTAMVSVVNALRWIEEASLEVK